MMLSLLLKKALPFTLTFVVGTALGSLSWLFGGSEKKGEGTLVTRVYDFKGGCGSRHRRRLVAESKPLVILFKPDARFPPTDAEPSAWVRVTFGAGGKVLDVEPTEKARPGERQVKSGPSRWEAIERAARGIQFTPETVNSVPTTVTKDVEIHFFGE